MTQSRDVLEALLRPRGAQSHWVTAANLALRYDITVVEHASPIAWQATRMIGTPRIDGDAALSSFAHEIGHVIDPLLPQRPRLHREFAAWTLAIELLGSRWSVAMTADLKDALPTYRGELRGTGDAWDLADRRTWWAVNELAEYRGRLHGVVTVDDRIRERNEARAIGEQLGVIRSLFPGTTVRQILAGGAA